MSGGSRLSAKCLPAALIFRRMLARLGLGLKYLMRGYKTMYAIIQTGGKQYRVAEGDTLKLEKLAHEVGEKVVFDRVLMVGNDDQVQVGTPFVATAKVTAEVLDQGRRDKIFVLKFKRRKHHMKQQGHRQDFTAVKITEIAGA